MRFQVMRVQRSPKTWERLQCELQALHGKGFLRMPPAGKSGLDKQQEDKNM